MQLQTLLLVLVVQGSSGLRFRDKPIVMAADHEFTNTFLPTLFSLNGKMALEHLVDQGVPSGLKVVQTNADGHHDVLEVFLHPLSEEHKLVLQKQEGFTASQLPGGFAYKKTSGTFQNGVENFLKMLLQDLNATKLKALTKCGAHIAANPNSRGGAGAWVILNGEKLSPEQLEKDAAFNNNNVLILGAPGRDVVAGKGRSIYIPGASLAFMSMKKTPMDLINRVESVKEDGHTLAYQHNNCKSNREGFFKAMCQGLKDADMKCFALGACGHNGIAEVDGRDNSGGRNVADRDDRSAARYSPYKFVEAFENSAGIPSTSGYSSSGYITEKIIPALLAGAVPVYAGADKVSEVFNAAALIEADPVNDPTLQGAISQMVALEKDPVKYKQMVTTDAVSKEQMKKFFSWHPATWETHGDALRQRIVDQVLSMCA